MYHIPVTILNEQSIRKSHWYDIYKDATFNETKTNIANYRNEDHLDKVPTKVDGKIKTAIHNVA